MLNLKYLIKTVTVVGIIVLMVDNCIDKCYTSVLFLLRP